MKQEQEEWNNFLMKQNWTDLTVNKNAHQIKWLFFLVPLENQNEKPFLFRCLMIKHLQFCRYFFCALRFSTFVREFLCRISSKFSIWSAHFIIIYYEFRSRNREKTALPMEWQHEIGVNRQWKQNRNSSIAYHSGYDSIWNECERNEKPMAIEMDQFPVFFCF